MDKLKKILKNTVAFVLAFTVFITFCWTDSISFAADMKDVEENEEVIEQEELSGAEDASGQEDLTVPDDVSGQGDLTMSPFDEEFDEKKDEQPLLGSGFYGKELNSQGYKVQITAYLNGAPYNTFREGILRYKDQYVFCYNPNKVFKETDNVTLYNERPAELTDEQAKTISMMIYYIFSNYNVLGEAGAINYYLGQCAIWNYINSINPGFNPYRIYITDSSSAYTIEQQEEALNNILAWVDANKDGYDTYIQYWINNDGDYQPVLYGWAYPIEKGGIQIKKLSAETALTNNNNNYSLEGAVYGVYPSESDANSNTNQIASITVDSNGEGECGDLRLGTYYVKELTAPKGYLLDSAVYPVSINTINRFATVNSVESPVFGRIKVVKTSANSTITDNNGNYSLADAVYGIYKTKEDAQSGINRISAITTGEDGVGISEKLPLGTYYVKEVTASKGFTLDSKIYASEVVYTNNASQCRGSLLCDTHQLFHYKSLLSNNSDKSGSGG